MVEIRLLGELAVVRDGKAVALPASKKTRALLAYLAATGRPQPREKLCGLLWDGPDDPRAALRWSLTKLRPLVDDDGASRLVADRERVELVAAGATIDVAAIRAAVPGGTVAGVARAQTAALRSVAGWLGGELVEGLDLPDCFRWHEWLLGEREQVRRLGVAILGALVERLAGEAPEEALAHARARIALAPLDDDAHAAVMRLYLELDRKPEALAHYTRCARLLERELGRQPSRELERLRIAIGATSAVVPAPAEPAPVPVARPALPLVGRSEERGQLERFAAEPAGSVLLLLGDPGIGKTRLLDELAAIAAGRGMTVARGRAVEAEMVRPYGAWLDALGALGAAGAFHELAGSGDTGDAERGRLFDAVRAELIARAAGAGLMVIVDDVQWIDEASAALLHFIARAVCPGVRLACAARPGDLADHPAGLRLVRSLTRERLIRQIGLSPLDAAGTAALTALHAPGVSGERVFAESGGHPLFAVEIARALARGDTTWDSLDALIGERLELLDGAARELVPWAAALGRAFTADVVAAITGMSLVDLSRAIDELERRAIVRTAGAEWELAHDLIRGAAYARISEPRRRLLHLQIARGLAALPDPDGDLAVEVAHHAHLGGDSASCAAACVVAGRRCLRLYAVEEAAAHAARGLAHAARLVGPQRARLQIELLRIASHADTRRERRAAIGRDLRRAILDAQAAGCHAEVALGYNELSRIHYETGDYDGAHADALDAEQRARAADPVTQAKSLAFSAQCLVLIDQDIPRAERLADEAARLLRPSGAEVPELPFALAMVRHHQGDDDAALTLLRRAAALAEERGEHWIVGYSWSRSALFECARGHFAEARAHAATLRALGPKMGEGGDVALGPAIDAIAALALGEPADVDAGLADLRKADAPVLLAAAVAIAVEVELARGDLEAASRHATESLAAALRANRASELAIARALVARVATIEGRTAAAAEQLAELSAIDVATLSARARSAVAMAPGAGAR